MTLYRYYYRGWGLFALLMFITILMTGCYTHAADAPTKDPVQQGRPYAAPDPLPLLPPNTTPLAGLLLVMVPMIISVLRQEIPKLPPWLVPLLGPGLGALGDYLLSLTGAQTVGSGTGAVLGMAGVGLREIKDQGHKRLKQVKLNTDTMLAAAKVAAVVIFCGWLCCGCAPGLVNKAKQAEYTGLTMTDGAMKEWALYYHTATNNPAAFGTSLSDIERMHGQVNALARKISAGARALDTYVAAYQTNATVKPWIEASIAALTADAPQLVALVAGLTTSQNQFSPLPATKPQVLPELPAPPAH